MSEIETLLAAGAIGGTVMAAPFYPLMRWWRPHETRRFHLGVAAVPFLATFMWVMPAVIALTLRAIFL